MNDYFRLNVYIMFDDQEFDARSWVNAVFEETPPPNVAKEVNGCIYMQLSMPSENFCCRVLATILMKCIFANFLFYPFF